MQSEQPSQRDDDTPFIIDGECVGHIHHDAGSVPYLSIETAQGHTVRIYGYAQIGLADGGGGEWMPGHGGMLKVIEAYKRNRSELRKLRQMTGQ